MFTRRHFLSSRDNVAPSTSESKSKLERLRRRRRPRRCRSPLPRLLSSFFSLTRSRRASPHRCLNYVRQDLQRSVDAAAERPRLVAPSGRHRPPRRCLLRPHPRALLERPRRSRPGRATSLLVGAAFRGGSPSHGGCLPGDRSARRHPKNRGSPRRRGRRARGCSHGGGRRGRDGVARPPSRPVSTKKYNQRLREERETMKTRRSPLSPLLSIRVLVLVLVLV